MEHLDRAPNYFEVSDYYDKNKHYSFPTQAGIAKYGCGPFAVGIYKEQVLKRKLTLAEWDALLAGAAIHNDGTTVNDLVQYMALAPAMPIVLTKDNRIAVIRAATPDKPVLISWKFDKPYGNVAGHFNVCIGPALTRPDRYIILDSAFGLNYLTIDKNDTDFSLGYFPWIGCDGPESPKLQAEPAANAKLEPDDNNANQKAVIHSAV